MELAVQTEQAEAAGQVVRTEVAVPMVQAELTEVAAQAA